MRAAVHVDETITPLDGVIEGLIYSFSDAGRDEAGAEDLRRGGEVEEDAGEEAGIEQHLLLRRECGRFWDRCPSTRSQSPGMMLSTILSAYYRWSERRRDGMATWRQWNGLQ